VKKKENSLTGVTIRVRLTSPLARTKYAGRT